MSREPASVVLVGGGLAAAEAAAQLRSDGFDGELTLIGEEAHAPYERPPLSKAVLVGQAEPSSTLVHPAGFYDDHGIELLTGDPAAAIDRDAGTVTTRAGAVRRFDRLLLATGAVPRRPELADHPLDGVVTLRTRDDAVDLQQRLRHCGHVTVVGAGWIGCEVAAAARQLGTAVAMVDPLATPLQRVLGRAVGGVFAQLHRDHGVDLRLGAGVVAIEGGDRAERVRLTDGSVVDTGLVVVGVGARPRTELADDAGLEVRDGVLVDATLRTSDPRIHAAGDVANAWHPRYGRHLRVEHWANARHQGRTAAANLLGAGRVYDRLPYFYTDQYDLGMEYVGHAADWDRVVLRGDPATREFLAFWIAADRVVAAMHVNVWDVIEELKAVVTADRPADADRLADPDVPLSALPGPADGSP